MADSLLTQAELKERLHYDPDTGLFTWAENIGSRARAGDEACGKNHYGYIHIGVNGKRYMAHRLAFLYMIGRFPLDQTDHINHNPADNRWINLREVNNIENGRNISMKKNNTSGVTGVHWNKQCNKWRSRIALCGVTKNLGSFENKNDAVIARKMAEQKYGFHENHGRIVT